MLRLRVKDTRLHTHPRARRACVSAGTGPGAQASRAVNEEPSLEEVEAFRREHK